MRAADVASLLTVTCMTSYMTHAVKQWWLTIWCEPIMLFVCTLGVADVESCCRHRSHY